MKTNSILFCLIAFYANINMTANAQVNEQDSLALVDLYNSTHGVIWYDHTNWLTSKPVSTWYGITVTNTRVTVIYMGYNNLNGSISSSFGNLVNLNYLWLSNNHLTGSIPSSIGKLANLKELDISDNQLTGSIPTSIGNLVNLEFLYLYFNQLSGSIPASIGKLLNLNNLYLNNNRLSGSIPSSIGNLVNLYFLYLNNNRLSGSIPSSLNHLSNLNWTYGLNLSHNHSTFDGLELFAQTFPYAIYAPQKLIPVHQNSNTLSVSAGGTLSNNTYKWFRYRKTGITLIATITGDSVFHPTQNGLYSVKVTNSIATQLKLHSDTIYYD